MQNFPFKKFFIRQLCHVTPLLFTLLIAVLPYAFSDLSLTDFYRDFRREHDFISAVMRSFSRYGTNCLLFTYAFIFIASVVRKNYTGRRFCIAFGTLQYFFVMILLHLTKMAIGSPRPYTDEVEHQFFTLDNRYHSFPSGHTGEAFGCSSPLAQISRSNVFAFFFGFIPATIAYSRVYLGKHHPVDLFAGMFFGSLTSFLVVYVLVNPAIWQHLPFKKFFNAPAPEEKEALDSKVEPEPKQSTKISPERPPKLPPETPRGPVPVTAPSRRANEPQTREERFALSKLSHFNFEKV